MSVARRTAILAVLALAAAVPRAEADASTFQADPGHSGYVPAARSPGLHRRWVARLDFQVSYPVASGGRVFVVTKGAYDNGQPHVVALDLRTGRRLWSRSVGLPKNQDNVYGANITAGDGLVYVTRDVYYDPEGKGVLALSAADGRVVWQATMNLFETLVPVFADGVLYLGAEGPVFDGGGHQGLASWRASDGAERWGAATGSGLPDTVAVAGDQVIRSDSCPPYVYLYSRATGRPASPSAQSGCSTGIGSMPVVADNRVFVSDDYEAEGIYNATTGARIAPLHSDAPPAVAPGVIVAVDARIRGERPGLLIAGGHTLVAHRLPDRKVLWRFRGDGYLDSLPLIVGRRVYVGSGSGRVYALSLRRGRVLGVADAGAPAWGFHEIGIRSGLASSGGMLMVPGARRLVAFG